MKKYKTMWLIKWEGTKETDNKIIGFLNGSISSQNVANYIENLYLHSNAYSLEEKLFYGRFSKKIPYKIENKYRSVLSCGNNPFITAEIIKDAFIKNNQLCYTKLTTRERE